jgi:membrane protease YdiL (CAAX protease family)
MLMRRAEVAKRVLRFLAAGLLWELAALPFFVFPPLAATAWVASIVVLFLWLFVVRGRKAPRLLVRYRQRRLGPPAGWLLAGVLPLLVFQAGLLVVWVRIVGFPVRRLPRLDAYLSRPLGWLPLLVLIAVLAPLVEEFFFRGAIQGLLERRFGAWGGIAATAVLFAALHLDLWGLPARLVFGVAAGFAVYATRSIWAGVILHVANNAIPALAYYQGLRHGAPSPRLPGPGMTVLAAVLMLVSGLALVFIADRLMESRQRTPELDPDNILGLG